MTEEQKKKYVENTRHFAQVSGVACRVFDIQGRNIPKEGYCASCQGCDYINTHRYGCYEAQRWGGRYIYYCPKGFIFIAAASPDELGRPEIGVLSGPIVMGDPSDFWQEGIDPSGVPHVETSVVTDMAELMVAVFVHKQPEDIDQDAMLNDIYKVRDAIEEDSSYPIELEKRLQSAIASGDKQHSKELLNQLLGYIFFCSNGDLATIKDRVLELVVLLSRSAIEGGAQTQQIFLLSSNYRKEVEAFHTVEELSAWLATVIDRFISYVFEFKDVKHSDILFKVMSYINANYRGKLTLDDIAGHVYLSKSYLSKIFKDEMNTTLTSYINRVRVEKSKELLVGDSVSLVDVAGLVGFEDQSYYTKVFKKIVGMSPGKFRNIRGKKES